MCLKTGGTISPGHVKEVPDLQTHNHIYELETIKVYEVWRCPVCGQRRYVPVLDGWSDK